MRSPMVELYRSRQVLSAAMKEPASDDEARSVRSGVGVRSGAVSGVVSV